MTILRIALIIHATLVARSLCIKSYEAFQFLAYRSKSSLLGAHTTLINTNAAHLGSKSLNVKAVLLEEGEFSQEAVKSIIESKASGIVALVPNQSFVPSEKWSQAYDYLLENGKNIPTYFAVKSDEVAGLARRVKKNTTTKVIAEKKLGSGSSKQKFVDIIGEIRDPENKRQMDSTMLVSSLDSFYISTEAVLNYPETVAGALAHMTILRGVYYLTQQYREFKHNLMNYFSALKLNSFSSVDQFLKKNDHSHFTTGIKQIVILKRLTSSRRIKAKVYNVKEDDKLEFTYLDDLVAIAKKYRIEVDIELIGNTYFQQFAGETIVFEDDYGKQVTNFDVDAFKAKVNLLQDFFISKTFGINSERFNNMLKDEVNNESFIQDFFQFLSTTNRGPSKVTKGSSLVKDYRNIVQRYLRKDIVFEYSSKDHTFYQNNPSVLKIAEAKPALFDLFMFFGITIFLLVLNLLCDFVGYSEAKKRKEK